MLYKNQSIAIKLLLNLLILCFVETSAKAQTFEVADSTYFKELPFDPSFPFGNNLVTFYDDTVYLLQSYSNPLGMKKDSLCLFKLEGTELKPVQHLAIPKSLKLSYLRSLGINTNFIFFSDDVGLYVFRWNGTQINFEKFIHSNGYRLEGSEIGYFLKIHKGDKHLITSDFRAYGHEINSEKAMELNLINPETFTLDKKLSVPVNHLFTYNTNAVLPLDISPSGKLLAFFDHKTAELKLYTLSRNGINLTQKKKVIADEWKFINTDSFLNWNSQISIRGSDYQQASINLHLAFYNASNVKRCIFINNNSVLILGSHRKTSFLKLYDLRTDKFYDLDVAEFLMRWPGVDSYTFCVDESKNTLYCIIADLSRRQLHRAKRDGNNTGMYLLKFVLSQ